jgi:acetoin utilization deacetylase AcuC-like enzyme
MVGWAGGRLVVVLEGGYDLQGLSESVVETFLGALGRPSSHALEVDGLVQEPLEAVADVLREVKRLHDL